MGTLSGDLAVDPVDLKQPPECTEPASLAQEPYGYASEFLSSPPLDNLTHLSTSDCRVPAEADPLAGVIRSCGSIVS